MISVIMILKIILKELFSLFAHMIVYGRVQGVGFRHSTQLKAIELHLTGWVRNKSDGTVEIEVEGKDKNVEQFIHQVETGFHKFMRVEHVDVNKSDHKQNYKDFLIR